MLGVYQRIEDWHGAPDAEHRGTGGLIFVQPAPGPSAIAPAFVEGARELGIPSFNSPNGRMMEGGGGCSIADLRVRDGRRLSIFRSYTFPYMDRPNLTVLTQALVTRVIFEGKRATGVEVAYEGKIHRIGAGLEVVLSLGAIHTPKVLMQSGIGDQAELQRLGIPRRAPAGRRPKLSESCPRGRLHLGVCAPDGAPQQRDGGDFLLEE